MDLAKGDRHEHEMWETVDPLAKVEISLFTTKGGPQYATKPDRKASSALVSGRELGETGRDWERLGRIPFFDYPL